MYEEASSCFDPNSVAEINVKNEEKYQMQQQLSLDYDYSNNNNIDPDLLSLCPGLTSSILSFSTELYHKGGEMSSVDNGAAMNDPLFHLNLPPHPPSLRDLLQGLPTPGGYGISGARGCGLFVNGGGGGVDDHGEVISVDGLNYQDGVGVGVGVGDGLQQFENGVLQFSRDVVGIGDDREGLKVTKHYTTERHRRVQMNDKFKALRSLVPSPTRDDKASIVGDAIEYIKELKRTVNELKLLMDKKRCGKDRIKRLKTDQEDATRDHAQTSHDSINPLGDPADNSYGSLRSSWLQRKSKDTEVDVRIIEDEVTVKLVQRKKINCLLFVSKVLDELQLELHHVAGGVIGEYCSFIFNTKICEGSSVYASAIANRMIEVVDEQYAAASPTNGY